MNGERLDTLFQKLLDRAPTQKERDQLLRTARVLRLEDDNGIWLPLIAFGHYETIYERIPGKIREAAAEVVGSVRSDAEAFFENEKAKTYRSLVAAVREAATATLRDDTRARLAKHFWIAIAVAALLSGVAGLLGWHSGFARGESSAQAAAAWSRTADGKAAVKLGESGVISLIRQCQKEDAILTIYDESTADRATMCAARGSGSRPARIIATVKAPDLN